MNKILISKCITFLLVILNMIVIFNFSAEKADASKNTSKKVTETVLEITVPDFNEKTEPEKKEMVKETDSKIRTLAHFSEYTLLGFLVSLHLSLYKMSKIKKASIALSGCTLYSVADEIHQIFVPGRGFQLVDILTDISGSLLGGLLLFLLVLFIQKCKKDPAVK